MALTSYSPSPIDAESRRKRPTLTQTIATVAALFGAITAGNVVMDNEHRIERTHVSHFWHELYFPNAPLTPDDVLENLTTKGFRATPLGESKSYRGYWLDQVDHVDHVVVGPEIKDLPNQFHVNYKVHYLDGTTEKIKILVDMKCASWIASYVPFVVCSPEDVRLNDSIRVR